MSNIVLIIASFFGAGYSKFAPGTVGTLFAAVLVYLCRGYVDNYIWFIPVLVVLSYVIGIWSVSNLPNSWDHDDNKIVIDEAHGFFITFLFIPYSLELLIIGFVLFRVFDIFKPLGIRRLDKLESHHSVMLDDTLAGIYANIMLQLIVRCGVV